MYIVFFRSIFHTYKRSSFTVLRSQIITLNLYEKHCETKVDQKKLTVFFLGGGGCLYLSVLVNWRILNSEFNVVNVLSKKNYKFTPFNAVHLIYMQKKNQGKKNCLLSILFPACIVKVKLIFILFRMQIFTVLYKPPTLLINII